MDLIIDLRFALPPLLNFILLPFGKFYWDGVIEILESPISKLPFLMLVLLFLLIFLFTSIELPLTANPIRLRPGNFSALLALAIVASIILPPSIFWFSYLFLTILSPCRGILWSLFKYLFNWLRHTLQSFPTIFVSFFTQNPDNPEHGLPDSQLQVVIDGEH